MTSLVPFQSAWGLDPERLALVKAGFVLKFPEFVVWPEGADQGPLEICVAGPSELIPALRSVASHIRDRRSQPEVRQLNRSEAPSGCRVLFIPRQRSGDLEQLLATLAGRAVLTVGDTPGFAERGVDIDLFTEADRVRFDVNRGAAEAHSLKLSFRLLEMARSVLR